MTTTVANIIQGKPAVTGGILKGTTGATLPTTATAAPTGFTALGYAGDNGLVETINRTTNQIRAWGGDTVKVVQTDFSVNYTFTLIESLNANTLKAAYGDTNVTTTAAGVSAGTLQSVAINGGTLPILPWIFDMKDGLAKIRVVIPKGQITAIAAVNYTDAGVIGYDLTLEAFADSSGNQAYKYIDDGVFSG